MSLHGTLKLISIVQGVLEGLVGQRGHCWIFFLLILDIAVLLILREISGNTGVAVLLYEPKYSQSIFRIERESGVKFEHISAPQPADVAESAGSEAADAISNVSDRFCSCFMLNNYLD